MKLNRFQASLLRAPMVNALFYIAISFAAFFLTKFFGYELESSPVLLSLFGLGVLGGMGIIFLPAIVFTVPLIYGLSWLATLLALPIILLLKNKTTYWLPYAVTGVLAGLFFGKASALLLSSHIPHSSPFYILINDFSYVLPGLTYMTTLWFLGIKDKLNPQ